MDDNNNFTGHAVLNTPLPVPEPTFELDFHGSCTFRQGDVKNGMDCKLDVPAFGLSNVGRFCVVMGGRGGCFDEFRCVDTNEPGVSGLGRVQAAKFRHVSIRGAERIISQNEKGV